MAEMAVEDAPLEFNASGSDTGPDMPFLRYQWSFGDGTDRSPVLVSPRIKHSYTKAGVYTASVTVTDDNGAKGQSFINITVANVPPTGMTELSEVRIDEDSQLTLTGTGYDTASDIGSLAFRWDLGDGNITEWMPEPTAVHTYTMSGDYAAMFYVRDNDNASASATLNVTVRNVAPTCTVTTADQEVSEDVEVSFEGAGRDTPTDLLFLQFRWDFDDGNLSDWMTEAAAVHAYAQKGIYVAKLTVRDNDGVESRSKVEITVNNLPPVAKAKASKTTVDEDALVAFTSSGSTDTLSDLPLLLYSWDFGDGKTAEGPAANHSYSKQKTFTVVLAVTDNDGAKATAELTIKASNVAPTVKAAVDRIRGPAGTQFNFSAGAADTASDQGSLRYDWNFGDLSTGAGQNASHTYLAAGFFKATLKVTDDEGASVEDSVTVEVYKAARPVEPGKQGIPLPIIGGVIAAVAVVAVVAALMMMRGKRKAHYEQAEADRAKK
jgi:PKD repeat protein